ncbi:12082_t:CDS:2 [Cetraspora pellucida]|uniref:12082_t:CDS:1 n=1 Tax=Cetraspora pellucida TaxID=1433469 RepID=A0A9N9NXB6_9GLOM|nr:12082_t:CDS:2 [Cetraspora pellucida]
MATNTLSYDAKFNIHNDGIKFQSKILNDDEWKTLYNLIHLLYEFEKATALLGGSNYVTLSAMFPIIQWLIYNLHNNYSNIDDTTIQAVHNTILTDMEKRWGTSPRYAIIALFFDPRFKLLTFIEERNLQQENNILIENDFNEFIIQQKSKPNMASFFKSSMNQDSVITSEFENYLFIPEVYTNLEEFDPITWWKAQKSTYPTLCLLACKYLGIPASSVPSEWAFSYAGNHVTIK